VTVAGRMLRLPAGAKAVRRSNPGGEGAHGGFLTRLTAATDFCEDESPEDDRKVTARVILGSGRYAQRCSRLGWEQASRGEKRQEGTPAATSRRGFAGGSNP
jgi:hypothetical protein